MLIIPIGLQCTSSTFKIEIQKTHSYPFDWMFATPKFVFEMLVLLLEENMDVEQLVRDHFFCCDKKADSKIIEYYYTCEDGFALYNTKYKAIFPHDHLTEEDINKYIRRFNRLKEAILNSSEELYFVYASQCSLRIGNLAIDNEYIVNDVYIYLSKIYRLIGQFRSNYKMVLFDAIQNEPLEYLDSNIVLCKLNSCSHWNHLVPQMKNYINLFK